VYPDFSLKLGRLLSRSSRERKFPAELKSKKEQGLVKFADKMLAENDLVVMGHAHSPKIMEMRGGNYVNLGDWIVHNTYLEMFDGKLELKQYTE
jgi:UDP-2,3-diacylglucosamine pyrophosphatase LpxH